MSGSKALDSQIISLGEKHDISKLLLLIEKTSAKELTSILNRKLGRNECITFWNYLLQGFNANNLDSREKRFACVKCFLEGLSRVELSYKQMYDLITRLCQDLNTFPSDQLVEILEHCIDGMRMGDPKCVGWKDLLPETLNVLSTMPELSVNGITMSGAEYRDTTVKNLYSMKWSNEVMTPIADMFRELNLTSEETVKVLNKFSGCLQSLAPDTLPSLSYQLFSMCSKASEIIIPILALEKYFHRFYYKKLFSDMSSNSTDFDSIDAFSDKELREAEETILHHLNYCTQYKINEIQMSIVLRNFVAMPDIILTPFVLSAILCMSSANREPDCRLSSSILLPFLRSVIKHNEDEILLSEYSVWCRDSLQRKQVDLEQIFTVLIDQNKDGKDTITPGLVNLVFVLLKAKHSPQLNQLAIGFLTKFIRKRFVFGQGIVKKLAEWMVVEQEQNQYSECLTLLSVADTFTVSECTKTINYVMDYFLWLPGDQSMRMMSFILPILKISALVRDAFIEVLRKAMHSSELNTRRMAVYGFCMILKQLNNSNSQRSQMNASGICTQHTISGFSLMSQATLGNRNNPQRHFDMLTLEIIGVLRSSFHQPLDIKICLYENLQRAVELNPKLVPHVLQFVDWHFRSFFVAPLEEDEDNRFAVKFEKIVCSKDLQENEIEIHDNLGRLLLFVSHCLVIFEQFETEYDTREMKRLIKLSLEKLIARDIKFEDMTGSLTHLKNELILQQLNFIEGLMAYSLLTSKQTNENVKHLLPLFKEHENLYEGLKNLSHKKGQKKQKPNNDNDISNVTINGIPVKKIQSQPENIWDLNVIEKFLRLLHEDIVPFAPRHDTTPLRSKVSLVRYVLEVAAAKVERIRLEPAYKQLAHSKRTLKLLTDITKVIYERCIKRLPDLWRNFDMKTASLAVACFRECLQTANEVYKGKFQTIFIKGFDFHTVYKSKECIAVLQDTMDDFMKEELFDEINDPNDTILNDADGRKIPYNILLSLEILYDNISFGSRMTIESYSWLLKFCKTYEIKSKEIGIVHKLLFRQRQKTHSGAFFQVIPLHLAKIWSHIRDEGEEEMVDPSTQTNFNLKSITETSAESCLFHLYDALRKQLEDVEYFIIKANNLAYKCRIVPEDDRDFCVASLKSLERSICLQLVHISNTLLHLTNVCIPLGTPMDGLAKLIMQHYICLKNLSKHFLNCCAGGVKVSIQGTKFDSLLSVVGKPLPTNIYALITYIESNILEDTKKTKSNPQAEKAKVLRETKFIPKIILCIENFNKNVITLAKKTNDKLANFLHFGTVRDFRIKTSDLKAAIDRTLSHSSQIQSVESGEDEDGEELSHEVEDNDATILRELEEEIIASQLDADAENSESKTDDKENSEEPSVAPKKKKSQEKSETKADKKIGKTEAAKTSKKVGKKKEEQQPEKKSTKKKQTKRSEPLDPAEVMEIDEDSDKEANNGDDTLITPDDAETLDNESNRDSCTQLMKNLAKINAKTARKRTLRDSEPQETPDVLCAPPLQPQAKKSRRGRK